MLAARNVRSTAKKVQERDSSSASGNLAARTGVPDAPDLGAVGWSRELASASSSRNDKFRVAVNLPAPPSWWDGAMGTNPERFRPIRAPQGMQSKLRRLSWHRSP